MAKLDENRSRLLVRIATLYFDKGLNQEQIARTMRVSRPQISRMLAEAQTAGIVQITIRDPFSPKSRLERRLAETFGLKEAVIAASTPDVAGPAAALIAAGAALLERLVDDGDRVGVNAGTTLSDTCAAVRPGSKSSGTVIPLVGGWGPSGARWQANLAARTLAERLGCSYLQLNAPAFVSTPQVRDALLAESEIGSVLARGRESNLALVGIGQLSDDATLFRTTFLGPDHLRELRNAGAVANICNSFIDRQGQLVEFAGYDRMVGLSIGELHAVPAIMGVAAGREKVEAILAALRGRWLHYFVTDTDTAEAVLSMEQEGR